ncbi:hypothetical protein NKR23_g10905 [Pleurostoma richardsiae]|uniref:Uncharacterized protein n=1 Tax=Pleurostoma richardsiae TaxID=41990 RepID=A0AA38RBT3_9PEZI|nr:hypothetical protein NKR23_g10905 [Pleurostoma richardsiae]
MEDQTSDCIVGCYVTAVEGAASGQSKRDGGAPAHPDAELTEEQFAAVALMAMARETEAVHRQERDATEARCDLEQRLSTMEDDLKSCHEARQIALRLSFEVIEAEVRDVRFYTPLFPDSGELASELEDSVGRLKEALGSQSWTGVGLEQLRVVVQHLLRMHDSRHRQLSAHMMAQAEIIDVLLGLVSRGGSRAADKAHIGGLSPIRATPWAVPES